MIFECLDMFVGVGDSETGHLMDLFKEYSGEKNNPSLKGSIHFLRAQVGWVVIKMLNFEK